MIVVDDPLRNHFRLGGRRFHRNLRKRWRRIVRRLVRVHAWGRLASRLLRACLGSHLPIGFVALRRP